MIYIFFRCFFIIFYYKILNVTLYAIQWDLVVYLAYIQLFASANPKLLIYPSCPFPFGNHNFVFYVCEFLPFDSLPLCALHNLSRFDTFPVVLGVLWSKGRNLITSKSLALCLPHSINSVDICDLLKVFHCLDAGAWMLTIILS